MKEIQTLPLTSMNNAAHFLFVSNMSDRAEKDAAVAEKCATQVKALREADYAAFIDYANTEIAHFKQEVLGGSKKKGAE